MEVIKLQNMRDFVKRLPLYGKLFPVLVSAMLAGAQTAKAEDKKLWDEVVSDANRPSAITTGSDGNYVIHISEPEHLAWYAWKLGNEVNPTELSKYSHAELYFDKDLDMSAYRWRGIGEKIDEKYDFAGIIDGQGHTISNLVMDGDNGDKYSGLLDEIKYPVEIRNIRFYKAKSSVKQYAGIVAGEIYHTSNVLLSNLTFEECSVSISGDYSAGIVVGCIDTSTGIVFDNIVIRKCEFLGKGEEYGGITGCIDWGDCSVKVRNSFISVRPGSSLSHAPRRTGAIVGLMDHASTLEVDNCVLDLASKFFNYNQQGAIVGKWEGTSKPKVSHTLVISDYASQPLPNTTYEEMGLFAGYASSSSKMELSDCFINWGYSTDPKQHQIISKEIDEKGLYYGANVAVRYTLTDDADKVSNIVMMNRQGARYGISGHYDEDNGLRDLTIPLKSGSDAGKIIGFTGGKGNLESLRGGRLDAKHTIPSGNFNFVNLEQGSPMEYLVKVNESKWIVADETTNMTGKKRTGKWAFEGIPTADNGNFKFNCQERPKIAWLENPDYEQVSQRITLRWQVANADVFNSYWKPYGKWYIYRNGEKLDSISGLGDMEWVDYEPLLNTMNTYKVYYVSDAYMYGTSDNKTVPEYGTYGSFDLKLKYDGPVIKGNRVINSVEIPNARCLDGCRVRLLCRDSENGDATSTVAEYTFRSLPESPDETVTITAEEEKSDASLCTTYYYQWVADEIDDDSFRGKVFSTEDYPLIDRSGGITFTSFSATKGKYTRKVVLKWSVDNRNGSNVKYVVYRAAYDKDNAQFSDGWEQIYETGSGLASGSYDDETLPGYVYRYCIRAYPFCGGVTDPENVKDEMSDIGFAASRGTIQGHITYSSGANNVSGVDVRLQAEESELTRSMESYAMQFYRKGQYMPLVSDLGADFWNGEWTLQFLLNPQNISELRQLLSVAGYMALDIREDKLYFAGSTDAIASLNTDTFQDNYITLCHDGQGFRLGLTCYDQDADMAVTEWSEPYANSDMAAKMGSRASDSRDNGMLYFGSDGTDAHGAFSGAVDEIRLWKGCLSDRSIADTYNRYLSGNEHNLMAYYTFESGVAEYAFDSSHPSGTWNGRDAVMPEENAPQLTTLIVPDSKVLTYRGITDANGEYTISGVPFEGEGTNWDIVPSYGAHDFRPASVRRMVNDAALVHSGIDFADISSFKVRGRVYFEHTNYPVQGCNVMIDGQVVMNGSSLFGTNADGEFEVDVPIGTHTLSLKMDGHTFTDSLTMYFNKPVYDLIFFDNTLVTVAGRVDGGAVEYEKPLGFGVSENNIGTATITLKPANGNYFFTAEMDGDNIIINPSKNSIIYGNALKYENSSVARTGRAASDSDRGDADRIYITTDSKTGEFAAKLPPIRYEVAGINIPAADDSINAKLRSNLSYLDARNTVRVYSDTAVWNGRLQKFDYNCSYKVMVLNPTVLEVWQNDDDRNFFGEDSAAYADASGKKEMIPLYADGHYTVSSGEGRENRPVFTQFKEYVFYLRSYQKYVNKDNAGEWKESIIPIPYGKITVSNDMAYENRWYVDEDGNTGFSEIPENECTLDSLGKGVYKFKVGTPNTVAPYEESMTLLLNEGVSRFSLTGIVFGSVPYGNMFVTKGPDLIQMILRDPPGSNSSATWSAGSSIETKYTVTDTKEDNHGGYENAKFGGVWKRDSALGKFMVRDEKWGCQFTEDGDYNDVYANNDVNGWTNTITARKDISTSDSPEFDGPEADLYIGSSLNMVSGNGKEIALIREGEKYSIGLKDIRTGSFQYRTSFVYSQHQVKTTVIPDIYAERRRLIAASEPVVTDSVYYRPIVSYDEWNSYSDAEKDALIDRGPGKGYEQVGSHKMGGEPISCDSVQIYTSWIENWKSLLYSNEYSKVAAATIPGQLIDNYTFDAGSSQTITATTGHGDNTGHSHKDGYEADTKAGIHMFWGSQEFTVSWHGVDNGATERESSEETKEETTYKYVLKDGNINDVITVDRLADPYGYGDIFRTRAGQTSAYWEPQWVTEYYSPGTEIMAATKMVYKARLELVNPEQQIISGIRTGTSATVQFRLVNDSETGSNGYYSFCLSNDVNRNGAKCTCNGKVIDDSGMLVWIEYGKPVILTVNISEPENPVDDTYTLNFYLMDNVSGLTTGPMPVYCSECPVIVKFAKASSEISLAADRTVINSELLKHGDGTVTFTLSDYDTRMENLLFFELQQWNGTGYIPVGDSARWTIRRDGVTSYPYVPVVKNRIPDTQASVKYTIDLSDMNTYPNGEYLFRARTVSDYGNGQVEAFSPQVITVIRDASAPRPIGGLMPVNGTLDNGSEISVEFNEDLAGDIRKHTNVEVYGELKGNASARGVSLYFDGSVSGLTTGNEIAVSPNGGGAKSFNLWLKWIGGAGDIMSMGTDHNMNSFSIDEEGHLVISSNENMLKSTGTFVKGEWMFLSVVIDATMPESDAQITASYIVEDGKDYVWLLGNRNGGVGFNGQTITPALLKVGSGFHGYMQDLSVWNYARDMDASNSGKSLEKNRYTPGLMSYWPMTEGNGAVAEDVVSGVNLYLASESMWSIDNNNYAMRIEKGDRVSIVFSDVNTGDMEDYLLQLWFSIDESVYSPGQNDTASILSYPGGNTRFVITRGDGHIQLVSGGNTVNVGNSNYADGRWHQLSMMVKRSENGNAEIYLDGGNVCQLPARNVDTMKGQLYLGDHTSFSGLFDEIRIWSGLQNSKSIKDNLHNRYSTTDCPVDAYFPFEVSGLNRKISFTTGNYGCRKVDGDTVRLVSASPDVMLSKAIVAEKENVPALKNAPVLVTREFDITATERKIRISLSEQEVGDVQGTVLTALVRGLRDKAGNIIQDIRWSFLVDRNDIDWSEMRMDAVINRRIEGTRSIGLAQIHNNTGLSRSWRIDNIPEWMELSATGGTIAGNGTYTLAISANESMRVGSNDGILSLIDDSGICHNQSYSINYLPDVPEWNVDSLYSQTMTITGLVRVNNVIQENAGSKLAAFNSLGDCVGVTAPMYVSQKNSYYYTLMVSGNDWYVGKSLTFKFYDATTGTLYASVEPDCGIVFGGDYSNYGSIEAPVYWDTTSKIEQSIEMRGGWNWISFNTIGSEPIGSVFDNSRVENYYEVKDQNHFARYEDGEWGTDADFTEVSGGRMYKVKANGNVTLHRIGEPINAGQEKILINQMRDSKPAWSWLGANITNSMPLTTAMGGLSKAPVIGDIVKSSNRYAEYTASGWIGDLTAIVPGKGYMYKSNDDSPKELVYPIESRLKLKSGGRLSASAGVPSVSVGEYSEYAGSATVIAAVECDGVRISDCCIYAIDENGAVRGQRPVSSGDSRHLSYLMIHGDEPGVIGFRVVAGNGENAVVYESETVLNFYDGLSEGSMAHPFIISIGNSTTGMYGIDGENAGDVHDIHGRYIPNDTRLEEGIYIKDSRKYFKE